MGRHVVALLLAVCASTAGPARADGALADCLMLDACMRILDKEVKASHDVLLQNPAAVTHLRSFGDPAKRALMAWAASDDSDRISVACSILSGWLQPVKTDIAILAKVIRSYHCGDNLSERLGQAGTPEAIQALVERLRWWGEGDGSGAILKRIGRGATPYVLAALGNDKVWGNIVDVLPPEVLHDMPHWTAMALDRAQPTRQRVAALRILEAGHAEDATATATAVRPLLHDPDRAVADAARETLRSMADPSVLGPVAQACPGSIVKGVPRSYTSVYFENGCIEEVAAYGAAARQVAPALIGRYLASPNGQDRAYGAAFIGAVGYEPALPQLIALLGDKDWRVVYSAVRSLGWIRAQKAAPALAVTAQRYWLPEVRGEAAAALAALKPDGAPLEKPRRKGGEERFMPAVDLSVDATAVPDVVPCASERWQYGGLEFRADDNGTREVPIDAEGGLPAGRIVGINQGEWGGGLFWQQAGRKPSSIFRTNVIAVAPAGGGAVAAFGEVGAYKEYDPNPPKLPDGLEDITISNGPSGYGFVLSVTRDGAGNWKLAEIARLPRSPDKMKAVAPGLYAAWSGNRAVVFSKQGIEGLATCRAER
jgi:hypothetical protein